MDRLSRFRRIVARVGRSARRFFGLIALAGMAGAASPVRADTAPMIPRNVIQAGHGDSVWRSVAWMPDGGHAVTLSDNGYLIIWDPANGHVIDRVGQANCLLLENPSQTEVIQQPGLTNCVTKVGTEDPPHSEWMQPQALSISPDGQTLLQFGDGRNKAASDIETQVFDLETRKVRGWLHRRPQLWIGGKTSRLIVEVPGNCSAGACPLAVIDPLALTEIRPVGWSGGGALFAASADSERFAILTGDGDATHSLEVGSAGDLATRRFTMGRGEVEEIGFDRAGGRVFVRFARGDLRIIDLATTGQTTVMLAPIAAGARIMMTDIDRHAILAMHSGAGRGSHDDTRLIDYTDHRVLAKGPSGIAGVFAHRGAVLTDNQDAGVYLDLATAKTTPLGSLDGQTSNDGIASPTGPSLALSEDGKQLLSAAGWAQTIGKPGARTPLTGFKFVNLDDIKLSPSARSFAFIAQTTNATQKSGVSNGVWVFNLETSQLNRVFGLPPAGDGQGAISEVDLQGWISETQLAISGADGRFQLVDVRSGDIRPLRGEPTLISPFAAPPAGSGKPTCTRGPGHLDVDHFDVVLSSCFTAVAYRDGGLAFVSVWNWRRLFTLYLHPDATWFTVAGTGSRYDTNQSADTTDMRWHMPNQPWVSLPAETYMRHFYQPGLMGKLLACNVTRTCAGAFKPIPDLSRLNFVLPKVWIKSVRPLAASNMVEVEVDAAVSDYAQAANGKTRSGLYDLRLFRNGKLVAQWPGRARTDLGMSSATDTAAELCAWRPANRLIAGSGSADCAGQAQGRVPSTQATHVFTVPLASDPAEPVKFTAYAFNEDRVKGETADYPDLSLAAATPEEPAQAARERAQLAQARAEWAKSPSKPPRRAFILAIGVNTYTHEKTLTLHFAKSDADLMTTQLTPMPKIPGYEVHRLELTSDGGTTNATAKLLGDALTLLRRRGTVASNENDAYDPAAALQALKAAGVTASGLDGWGPATPDDVVIISFSGHGWTDPKGDFYLAASDTQLNPRGEPIPLTMISAASLTDWLRDVDAGETVIVIDACESAASVTAAGFKPGPFGDAGLGQLSFDKGIRILTAAQAHDAALEDADLHQGLLTYVLAHEGIDGDYGAADLNHDGKITLDEWLIYALRRLPAFSAERRLQREALAAQAATTHDFSFTPTNTGTPPIDQEPSLFDFTNSASPVVLRVKPRAAVRPGDRG